MINVINNTRRIIILSGRDNAPSEFVGSGIVKIYLNPGANLVDKKELDTVDKKYLDALVGQGDLVIAVDYSKKKRTAKTIESVKPKKEAAQGKIDLAEIDLEG